MSQGAGTQNTIFFAENADFSGNATPGLTANLLQTNGQLWIGSTALNAGSTHINVGTIASSDSSITIGYVSPNINLTVSGGSTVGKTITGNSGGALPPTAGNWNILGASTAAGTSPVTTSGAASTLTINVQKSQAIAATDATKIGLCNFDSAKFSVDANGFVTSNGLIQTITGDSGSVTGSTINLYAQTGSASCGKTVKFSAASATEMDLKVTDASSNTILGNGAGTGSVISGNGCCGFGQSSLASLNSGSNNNAFGVSAMGNGIITGGENCAFGRNTLYSLTSGLYNTYIGNYAGQALQTGDQNTVVGRNAGILQNGGSFNTVLGDSAAGALTSGSYNLCLGYVAGLSLTSTESSNIYLMNNGTTAESNTLRIGTQGSGNGQVNRAFCAGIVGVTVTNTQMVTVNSSTGQLGVGNLTGFTWTDITGATQTLAASNGYITDRGGGVTYTLPASGTLGDTIKIVGKAGLATVAQNANQQICIGSSATTVGVGGSIVATNAGDCIELICITAGASTVWRADSLMGNWTIV